MLSEEAKRHEEIEAEQGTGQEGAGQVTKSYIVQIPGLEGALRQGGG